MLQSSFNGEAFLSHFSCIFSGENIFWSCLFSALSSPHSILRIVVVNFDSSIDPYFLKIWDELNKMKIIIIMTSVFILPTALIVIYYSIFLRPCKKLRSMWNKLAT